MRKSTKLLAAVGASALVVGSAGIAYAYWTTTGAGTGSATSTTDVTADKIALGQIGTLTGFYPGSAAQDVLVQATNPAAFSQQVGEVTVTVAASTGTSGSCAASNWDIQNVTDNLGLLTKSGTATDHSTAAGIKVATIALKETGANQDGCKGVTPVLTFVSAPGA